MVAFEVQFFRPIDITAYKRAKKEEHLVVNPRKLINCPPGSELSELLARGQFECFHGGLTTLLKGLGHSRISIVQTSIDI